MPVPKKTYLNLYVAPEVKAKLEEHAEMEGRTLSNLCDRLLAWSIKHLDQAGDSHTLMTWRCSPPPATSGRRHLRVVGLNQGRPGPQNLHAALDRILENAPPSAVEQLTQFLNRADKYGDDK